MSNDVGVPKGIEIAAAWSWRILVIGVGGFVLYLGLSHFSEVTVPVAVAILMTALLIGPVDRLAKARLPRAISAGIVLIVALVAVSGLLALVGTQISGQFVDLRLAVVEGITKIEAWARNGPLGLSDAQISGWIENVRNAFLTSETSLVDRAASLGTTVTHFVAGLFIALFATFFFLYEGNRIWWWVTYLFPAATRERVRSSGDIAWGTLTSFVRATVIVAFVDALGIALAAWLLGVPLALAIGVLVFLGSFVPILGALVSGMVAVLVALVDQGLWTAIFMLIAVVAVQQIESHVLQPFLMGRFVAVHPLAIILAIAGGVIIAGVVGALVAVPTIACINAVVRHIADEAGDVPPDPDGWFGDPEPS